MSEWISVKDRLPEPGVVVTTFSMVASGNSFIESMAQEDGQWHEQDGDWWGNIVTHWMPLPAPPDEAT